LDSSERKIISDKIDYHNKSLEYPGKGELIKEKNIIINRNKFLDFEWRHPFNLVTYASSNGNNSYYNYVSYGKATEYITNLGLNNSIFLEAMKYNYLLGCKFYYESEDKTLLPNKFKNMWDY
jgi:hypothetical protein